MPTYRDLGLLVQQKYPEYQGRDPEQVGTLVAQKYPEYQQHFQPTPQPGIVQKVVGGLIDPAKRYGQLIGEAGAQLANHASTAGNRAFLNRVSTQPKNLPRGVTVPQGPQAYTDPIISPIARGASAKFMDQQSLNDFSTPGGALTQTAKRTAGGASYLIPGGGGLGGAALQGAAIGGLSEFSRPESTLKSTLGAAAGGAAFGAGGHIVGQAVDKTLGGLSKLANKSGSNEKQKVLEDIFNPIVKASPNAYDNEQKVIKELSGLFPEARSSQDVYKQMPKVLKDIGGQIKPKLGKTVPVNDAMSILKAAVEDSPNFDITNPTHVKELDRQMGKLFAPSNLKNGQLTDSAIREFKQTLGKHIGNKNFVADVTPGGVVTEKARPMLAAWNAADELMSKVNPKINNLTRQESTLFRASKGIQDAAKASGVKVNVPFTSTGFELPNETRQNLAYTAAEMKNNLFKGVGKVADGIRNKASQVAPVTGPIGGQLSGRVGGGLGSMLGGGQAGEPTDYTQNSSNYPNSGPNNNYQSNNVQGQINHENGITPANTGVNSTDPLTDPATLAKAFAYDMAHGGHNAAKIKALYDMAVEQQKLAQTNAPKPKVAAAKDVNLAQSGIRSLAKVEQLATSTSKLFGATVPFGIGSRDYIAARDNVMDAIARLRTGAAMPASEKKFYENLLPLAIDPPEVRQQKIQQLREYFSSFAESEPQVGFGQ